MKKLYNIPWQWCRGVKKAGLSALVLFGATQILNAQVSGYTFSQSNGTFNSIATTGTLITGSEASTTTTNDTAGWTIAIPFTFNFNGVNYTSLYANSNGGVTFGTTTSNGSSLISSSSSFSGSISVMDRDLWGVFYSSGVTTSGSNVITGVTSFLGMEVGKILNAANGIPTGATVTAFDAGAGTITMSANATSSSPTAAIRYGTGKVLTSVVGTAPNRVFVIEWIGYNDYSVSATSQSFLNFQLRLEETSNKVNIVYGSQFNNSTTSRTNQIGLRGATNADYNNRSGAVANPWTATTSGITNSSSVSRDNTNFPASGLTYTWAPPTCIAPSTFVYSGVTTTSIDLAWTASPTPPTLGYEVYYSTTNTAPTAASTPNITGVMSTTTTISGLTPATTYYVWVRGKCSSSDASGWNSAGSFTTNCGPVTALTENFDSYTTGSILPACWVRMAPATTPGSQTLTSTSPASGTRNIYLNTSSTQNAVIVALPIFSNINAGTHRLKMKARVSTGNPGSLSVGYVTNISDNNSFVLLQDLIINNIDYTSGADYSIIPPTSVPAGARLAIKTTTGDGKSYYIDDVVWETIPTCIAPTAASITGVTLSSVSLSWTAPAPAPANGYQIYYSTTNTAPTAATVLVGTNSVTSATTSATITGLSANTIYYVWVRSNCATADQSSWTSAGIANTGYCTPAPSSVDNNGITNVTFGASPNVVNNTTGLETGNYGNYSSMIGNIAAGVPSQVSITYSTGFTYGTKIWVDLNNNLVFESSELLYTGLSTNANPTTVQASIIIPGTTPLGNYRMRIGGTDTDTGPSDACYTASYGTFEDYTVNVTATPSCLAPTAIMISGVTTSSLNVNYTAPASIPANGYDIYYSTSNTAPTATTVLDGTNSVTSSTTSATITGLTAQTVYYVWVRSKCSATDNSLWNGPVSGVTGYCIPGTTSQNTWISQFTSTGAQTNMAYSSASGASGGYNNASGTHKIKNEAGSTTSIEITVGGPTAGVSIWVDWNNNLIFEASEQVYVTTSYITTTPATASIMVPVGTPLGDYRMRVLTDWTVSAPSDPCSTSISRGEYVDYTFEVAAPLATGESIVKENGVNIYPNPFTDFIRISDVKDVVSVSIVDMSGRMVKTVKPANEINLSSLKSGMYLINLKMKDGSVKTVKSIKK